MLGILSSDCSRLVHVLKYQPRGASESQVTGTDVDELGRLKKCLENGATFGIAGAKAKANGDNYFE